MTSTHVAIVDLKLGRLPRRCPVKRRLYAGPAWPAPSPAPPWR
jgi:hypothetical protein